MPTHRDNVYRKYKLDKEKTYTLAELAEITGIPLASLKEVEKRGRGAYATNPESVRMKGTFKKGVDAPMSEKLSINQWARARVFSFIDGSKKHDTDLRRS